MDKDMIDQDCDQQAYDNNWTLERENACHIGILNDEVGTLSEAQLDMNFRLEKIEGYMAIQTWIGSSIFIVLLGLVIKKMWGNGKI